MPKRVPILAAIVITLPALAFAQTATIEGTVKDASAVTIDSNVTHHSRLILTNGRTKTKKKHHTRNPPRRAQVCS